MKQEYVLLRTENDLLNSLIGQSFNQRTKLEAYKILTEIHSKAQDRSIGKMALCYIVDKNEVLGVGGSTLLKDKNGKIISNLILDNFGIFLAGIFKAFLGGTKTVLLRSTTVPNEAVNTYGGNLFGITAVNFGSFLQVGSGSTPPSRSDFNIETAFGTAPESVALTGVSDPVFNSGLGNFKYSVSIQAGGAGTINESVSFLKFTTNVFNFRSFAMFRDIISPSASFIAGQTIALEYTIQLCFNN